MVAEVHLEVSRILCTVFVNGDASVKHALEFWVWSCKLKGVCTMWLVSVWNAIKLLDVLRSYIYHAYWGLYHYSIESKTLKCFSCPRHTWDSLMCSLFWRACVHYNPTSPCFTMLCLNHPTSVYIHNRYSTKAEQTEIEAQIILFLCFCSWLVLCQLFVFAQPSSYEYNKANRKTH